MTSEKAEPRTVTMYGLQWATVEAFAKNMGYPSVSSALRRIVDEWVRMRKDSSAIKVNSDG